MALGSRHGCVTESSGALSLKGYELARRVDIPPSFVTDGRYDNGVPFSGETMIGLKRLDNVRHCVERIIEDQVPGDFIETGVWRGGCAIFMRGILAAHGIGDKKVWLADSFSGVPAPDAARYPLDGFSNLHNQVGLAVSREDVEANFRRYGLLDDQVRFVEGWFEQTLPTLAGHTWSLIRLDGDLYQSTIEGLENLYSGLSPGGYCIVDDYGTYPACRQAVLDFRTTHKIEEPIVDIDGYGAFWRRTTEPAACGDLGSLHDTEERRPVATTTHGKRLQRPAREGFWRSRLRMRAFLASLAAQQRGPGLSPDPRGLAASDSAPQRAPNYIHQHRTGLVDGVERCEHAPRLSGPSSPAPLPAPADPRPQRPCRRHRGKRRLRPPRRDGRGGCRPPPPPAKQTRGMPAAAASSMTSGKGSSRDVRANTSMAPNSCAGCSKGPTNLMRSPRPSRPP